MSGRIIAIITIFAYACVLCWQYEVRKTVLCFCAVNLAAFLMLPLFIAGAVTGVSAAILLTIHQWQRGQQ